MVIGPNRSQHLTYCLNVHPGESWDDNLAAIETHALAVRERVAPGQPFGLGLRLSCAAAHDLAEPARLEAFKAFLREHDLYVFTVNGFPYGEFHDTAVKERVYAPDWRSDDRLAYTALLADILAALLPEDVAGSISTVPASYRSWIEGQDDIDAIVENLAQCATHLAGVEAKTGRYVALALEPEPDCLFDTVAQTVAFFTSVLADHAAMRRLDFDWRRYLGVCLDTCHLSVVFDDPAEGLRELGRHGILVPKVQISTALRADTGGETASRLPAFADGTYLHQVRMRSADGTPHGFPDLTDEAFAAVAEDECGEVRVHVHVPLYFEESGSLQSTGRDLLPQFFAAVQEHSIAHLEIETYTFNVLPASLAAMPIDESVAHEYQWVLERMASVTGR